MVEYQVERANRRKDLLRFPTELTKEEAKTHPIVMVNAVIVIHVDVDKVHRR